MFQRLLGRDRRSNQAIVDALYAAIVASARQPRFYSEWDVPDTPIGRFEMLAVHVFLFLRRMRGEDGVAVEIAQELTDGFFLEIDHSLRELGVGDVGVPKRMKKLARMFYGRVASYGEALDQSDQPALQQALSRNVLPDRTDWPHAAELATYVSGAAAAIAAQSISDICAGKLHFPDAGDT